MPLRAITGRGSSRRVQGSLIRLRTVTAMRLLAIAVGTTIAGCPPHGPGRALISASGSYLG
jgi:hypothetical protein